MWVQVSHGNGKFWGWRLGFSARVPIGRSLTTLGVTFNFPTWKIKVKDQTVQTGERPQTNGRTHGHYQTYYRPCYAVDKKYIACSQANRQSHLCVKFVFRPMNSGVTNTVSCQLSWADACGNVVNAIGERHKGDTTARWDRTTSVQRDRRLWTYQGSSAELTVSLDCW